MPPVPVSGSKTKLSPPLDLLRHADFNLTGLGRGGQQVLKSKEVYAKAVETLVELASLQTAFTILDEVIRATNRRVNAIEHVVIPRLEGTVKYIISELDEMDREEFFRFERNLYRKELAQTLCRLKKVQGKKKRDAENAEAARLIKEADEEDTRVEVETKETFSTTEQAGNLLNDKDEDVIF